MDMDDTFVKDGGEYICYRGQGLFEQATEKTFNKNNAKHPQPKYWTAFHSFFHPNFLILRMLIFSISHQKVMP